MNILELANDISSLILIFGIGVVYFILRKMGVLKMLKRNGDGRNTVEDIRHHAEVFANNSRHISYLAKEVKQCGEDIKEIKDNHLMHINEKIAGIEKDIEWLRDSLKNNGRDN